jgi:hypothetical protein
VKDKRKSDRISDEEEEGVIRDDEEKQKVWGKTV